MGRGSLLRSCVLALLSLFVFSATVSAQNIPNPNTDVEVQNFNPTPSPYGIFSVESAQGSSDLQISGGLVLNFAKEPLVVESERQGRIVIVDSQLVGDLLFAIGLWDMLELGLDLPVYFANQAELNSADIGGATIGDLMLRPKFTLFNPEDNPIGLALYANVVFPTGDDQAFTSSGTFALRPGVIVDTKISKLLLAFNLGANIQEAREFGNLNVGSELTYGLGAQYEITNSVLVGGELFGSTSFNDFFKAEETPMELLVGAKYRTSVGLNFELGAGGGLVPGYGSPAFRVLAGVRYANFDDDWDDDGILNNVDVCPREPEDRDLFEDEDGCPDPDNDNDGVCDPGQTAPICMGDDNCPLEAEDKDEFEDEDGCPDLDNDQDLIPDLEDECPNTPGVAEMRGCPTKDRDGDGILDDADACPDDPEDKDSFKDEDGCPEPDNDEDTVLDATDKCPGTDADVSAGRNTVEDKDSFEDEDGCPDPDNDNDGIFDDKDKCPNEPEVYNGNEDDDGCPDKGEELAKPVGDEIVILKKVYFKTGSAKLQARSRGVLNAVASILKNNPSITQIEIQGHTDDVGGDSSNLELSQNRAKSVFDYLVNEGVEPGRMLAKGYGETTPLVEVMDELNRPVLKGRDLKDARARNRRVQFKILKQDKGGKVRED